MPKAQADYSLWIADAHRKRSSEVDFGVWWRVPGSRATWRVSWIENTGELYAREQQTPDSDIFILLGVFPTRDDVEAAMEGWTEVDNDLARLFPELGGGGATPVQEAKRYVAAQLAYMALQHHQAAEACPNLTTNTTDAIRRLHDAATLLGFGPAFEASCSVLDVRLLDGRGRR